MKKHKTASIEELKTVAEKSFRTLNPVETDKEKRSATVEFNSYAELHLLVLNVLKVAVAALDAETHKVTNVEGTSFAVKSVLELAMQLIPLEEAYLLDEVYGMVVGEGE